MIFPFLDGFLTFSKVPITWLIVLLNVFLFSQNYSLSKDCQDQFQAWYDDSDFLYTQGRIYKQFSSKRSVAQVQSYTTLGRLAFRDESFIKQAPINQWQGDPIAIKKWQRDLDDFLVLRSYYPPLMFGVSEVQKDFFSFVSYQFYHEGFMHLIGNLLLVLIVGGFLERRCSGLTVFSVYLLGGISAAFFFTHTSGISGAPLVGASGSLCALLGFLLAMEFKTKTRLFYMFLPMKNYSGFVFVPTVYWIFWLCMISDVSGVLAQPESFAGGVAHMVHLMGFGVGLMMGIIYNQLEAIRLVRPRRLRTSGSHH